MTKFSSRAELLASGAREVTMEEMDWVSGGGNVEDSSAIIGTLWQNYNGVSIGNGAYVDSAGTITINGVAGAGTSFGGGLSFGAGFSFGADIPNITGIGFLPYNSFSVLIDLAQYVGIVPSSVVDFCGSGLNSYLVPDILFGIDISEGCRIHDIEYSSGSNVSRAEADANLRDSVYRDLTANGMSDGLASFYSNMYYNVVREFGTSNYVGNGTNN